MPGSLGSIRIVEEGECLSATFGVASGMVDGHSGNWQGRGAHAWEPSSEFCRANGSASRRLLDGVRLIVCSLACVWAVAFAWSQPAFARARAEPPTRRLTVARGEAISATRSTRQPYRACGSGLCDAVVAPSVHRGRSFSLADSEQPLQGSGELGGYDPQDLREAYEIPQGSGATQTIALVDAYGDPDAEADLATYRQRYDLPACTEANGCFTRVNQAGEQGGPYVETESTEQAEGWALETSLDIDMISAACAQCRILLVEANSEQLLDLAESVDTAANLGATEISNSYGAPEEACGPGYCES